jgi:hypothetical protein
MKYCRYCGGEVSDTARACGHCGRWLAKEPPSPSSVDPGPPELTPEAEPADSFSVTSVSVTAVPPEEVEAEPPAPARVEQPRPVPEEVARAPEARPPSTAVHPEVERPVPPSTPPRTKPRRSIPVWVWGFAAVALVVIVGGALAVMAAIGSLVQARAPEQATPTLVVTPWATRAPASVPEPASETMTIFLGRDDVWETADPNQSITVEWVWGVCDPELVEENIDTVEFKVTVDGRVVAMGNMAKYRTELREEERSGVHAWWQYYSYPMGSFRSGSVHWLELERGFGREVTDGCDSDEDGILDWYGPDSVIAPVVHITVR